MKPPVGLGMYAWYFDYRLFFPKRNYKTLRSWNNFPPTGPFFAVSAAPRPPALLPLPPNQRL